MVQKRFVFVKDFSNVAGGVINRGTTIDIVGENIFIQSNTMGGQVVDPNMYNMLHDFIEQEYAHPNFLREVPVPHNKC